MKPVLNFQGSAVLSATACAFRLPPNVRGERLLLTERSPETRFLIGHENSFFHPRAAFRLDTSNDRTVRR